MNKLFTKIAALALGATMAVGVGVAVASSGKEAGQVFADTSNFVSSAHSSEDITKGITVSNITYSMKKASGSSAPAYYSTGSAFRCYGGNTLTVTPGSGITINKIVVTTPTSSNNMTSSNSSVSVGTLSVSSGVGTVDNLTSTSAVVFTNKASSGHWRVQKVDVTYTSGGGGTTYTVTYNSNGGTGTMTDSNSPYASGASVTVLDNAFTAPSGYSFDHWNTAANNGGTSYAPGAQFTISGNVTLYAQWEVTPTPSAYDVVLDPTYLGISGDNTTEQTYTVGGVTYKVAPDSSTNKFKSQALGSGVENNLSSNATILIGKKGAYIYNTTAFDNPISEFVVYCNGGTASTSVYVNAAFGASSQASATFADNSGQQLATRDHVYSFNVANSNCTFFKFGITSAHNAQVQIGIKFADGPSTDPDVLIDPVSLSLSSGGTAGTIAATPNEYLSNPVYTWSIKSGGDDCVTLSSSTNVATVTPKTLSGISANVTIALEVTSSSDVSVDIQKEIPVTVVKTSSPTAPYSIVDAKAAIDANVGKTGAYVQGIVSQIGSFSSSSLTYYISDDGQTTNQLEVYSGKGLNGADFSSANDLVVGQHVIVTGNLTKYNNTTYEFSSNSQIYSFDSHTVTFDANEGTVSPTSATVTCGSTTTLPTPTRSGYTFDGWFKNDSGEAIAAGATTDRIVADTTYVAHWSEIKTLDHIGLSGTYQTSFPRLSTFNHEGLVVTAYYDEQETDSKVVTTLAEVSTPDLTTTGAKTVTVSYTESGTTKTKTYSINVTGIITGITTDMPASLTLDLEENSDQYTATIQKDEGVVATVVWKSDDTTIATVNNGLITASSSKTGSTTITVFADANGNGALDEGEFSSTCALKVVDPNAMTDTLTYSLIGVSGTSYTSWDNLSESTSALYKGTTAGNYSTIQMNSSSGYIMNKTAPGYVRTIVITYDSHTSNSNRRVSVYGNSTAFDSKSAISSGTPLGSVAYDGVNESYTINVDSVYEYEYFGIVVNDALYLTSVAITYEKINTDPSIQLIGSTVINGKEGTTDSTSLSVKVKNIVSPVFTFTYEEDGETSSSSSYVSVVQGTPDSGVYPLTISLNNAGTSIVHIDVSGQTASFTVTVIEVSYLHANLPTQYRLVTDDSTLSAGDVIVLGVDSKDEVMCNSSVKAGETLATASATIDSKIVELPSDTAVLTLGGSSGAWTLTNSSGKYLSITTSNTRHLQFVDSEVTLGISISNGGATISSSSGNSVRILLNASANPHRFSTYNSATSASMLLPEIYRRISGQQNVEIESDLLAAISSAESTFSCNAQGTSFDGTAFNSMSQYFTEVIKSKYFLDYADSNASGNIAEQWLAMYDYAVAKYGEDYDFLGRIASGKVNRSIDKVTILNIGNSSNAVSILIITSVVSLTAIGGYFFLRKRREQN
jgi:uncharacterized repeat protein (TIGR02543 family)